MSQALNENLRVPIWKRSFIKTCLLRCGTGKADPQGRPDEEAWDWCSSLTETGLNLGRWAGECKRRRGRDQTGSRAGVELTRSHSSLKRPG